MSDAGAPAYVNGLLNDYNRTWNGVGVFHTPATVSVGFTTGAQPAEYNGVWVFGEGWQAGATSLDAGDKANIQLAYSMFSEVANITFTGFTNSNAADIRISTSGSAMGSGGSFLPGRDYPQMGDTAFSRVFTTDFAVGGFGFFIALHEIGRTLGLKAPTEGAPILAGLEKSDMYSVMPAYVQDTFLGFGPDGFLGGFGGVGDDNYATTPLLYDIAALQWMYGANMTTRTGDDVYVFSTDRNHMAIWDAGGVDTLDLSEQTTAQIVNLNAGQFSSLGNTAGGIGAPNNSQNVAIAFDVTIENAVGGHGADTIFGNAAGNQLNGKEGADILYGGAGDDVLNGWSGIDALFGGAGADTYDVGESSDVVVEGAGQGYDIIRAFTSYVVPANVEEIALFSAADGLSLTGGANRDVLIGGDGSNLLTGAGGGDWMLGMGGDDTLDGGAAADTLAGGVGADTLYGGDGNDVLSGDAGVDVMYGGAGSDAYFIDNAGEKVFESGAQYDIAYGFTGWTMSNLVEEFALYSDSDAVVVGNNGANLVFAGAGSDTVSGMNGDDTLWAMGGNDLVYGGAGNDALIGWTGADVLFGGAGNDQVEGGEGMDTLFGGAGSDLLFGGKFGDADLFVIGADTGSDAIRDFETGVDRIDVSAFGIGFGQIGVTQVGGDLVLDLNGQASLQICGMNADQLSQGMFVGFV